MRRGVFVVHFLRMSFTDVEEPVTYFGERQLLFYPWDRLPACHCPGDRQAGSLSHGMNSPAARLKGRRGQEPLRPGRDRPTIAHRFIGGTGRAVMRQSRQGRKTARRSPAFVASDSNAVRRSKCLSSLAGLPPAAVAGPSDESLGYYQSSLPGRRGTVPTGTQRLNRRANPDSRTPSRTRGTDSAGRRLVPTNSAEEPEISRRPPHPPPSPPW